MPGPTLGWHSRGFLPHFDVPGAIQAVTFRLADAMPEVVVDRWRRELLTAPEDQRYAELHRRIAEYEDAGHGSCCLRDDRCAQMLCENLHEGHDDSYRLLAWVIMPNHVHVVVGPVRSLDGDRLRPGLEDLLRGWKGASARRINQVLGRTGALWQRESFDRWIRDQEHLERSIAYVQDNPVRAGLCREAAEWRWSSAYRPAG